MSKTMEIVKRKGFKVGDTLRGYEGSVYCDIIITAIGEFNILAKLADGEDGDRVWTLEPRDWEKLNV